MAPTGPDSPERDGGPPLALVYRGPASTPGCPEAVAAALRRSRWDLRVRFVGPGEQVQVTPAVLADARLYAQPGGGGLRAAHRRVRRSTGAVRDFVRSGGGYLGFCLGGYLAGETPGFGLLPGDADRFISSPGARPDHAGDSLVTLTWNGRRREMFFQDGPWFDLDAERGPAEVLATYDNGLPAAVVAPFGAGAVGVVGPHPEASPDWYGDSGLPVPADLHADLTQDLVDRVMGLGRAPVRGD
ncbi:BPL-N domain-containing protein [Blastococcus sp. SYSU D00669]